MAGSIKAVNNFNQDYNVLKSQCLAKKQYFSDPTFPAVPESLGFNELGPNSEKVKGVEWIRPKNITKNPQFIVHGATRTDINQGELGDCWLMAAIASLTLDQDILAHVIYPEQNFTQDYVGIFHFRLWQYGQWVDVVIDDKLPTKNGKLLFVQSADRNEFWSALLEKAYAKVNGCYEALSGGFASDAFEDFTGGIAESYELSNAPPNLFHIMKKALRYGSLLSTSISPSDVGEKEAETKEHLVTTHAYSITGAEKVHLGEERVELVRLRNPWGYMEWNGAWSDDSKEWDYVLPEEKARLDHSSDDGEFWMAYSDFVQHYSMLEICNLTPDSLDSNKVGRWNLQQFMGSWEVGSTAGGCRNHSATFSSNPQFVMKLKQANSQGTEQGCSVLVGLMQKRQLACKYNPIGFTIYKVPDKCKGHADLHLGPDELRSLKSVATCSFSYSREVSARFSLVAGEYVIIPSTFEPNQQGSFLLRVFSEK